ncbi:MAG: TIGR00725 family protein, partial [Chrysiogenales bacterium]
MKPSSRKKQVVVIGSSEAGAGTAEARAIGRFIAEKGYVLITGGRGGIMEAVSM